MAFFQHSRKLRSVMIQQIHQMAHNADDIASDIQLHGESVYLVPFSSFNLIEIIEIMILCKTNCDFLKR